MTKIRFIDTTLRDGQQSLWALNMTTGMMLPALEEMDEAGFEAMEFFVPVVQMKKMVRDLGEDPWQWLKLGVKKAKKTSLRLHSGYRVGLGKVPESVSKLLVQKVIDEGIDCCRLSNPWNNFEELASEVAEIRRMGMDSVVNLIYSVSPRHTDDYFVDRAKAAVAMKPYRLCFKDVGGLMTPDRMRELLPKIQAVVGDIDIELHLHCNNGLAPVNVLEAVKLGITHVHTAVPPLASGFSNPSIFNVARNLRTLGYDMGVDEQVLRPVEAHFSHIATQEGFATGKPLEYDETLYRHQVPGGMMSTLRYQLRKVGMEDHIEATLEEAGRVREEFGYPIMVTPLSQFVGTQAAINVMVGERYKQVTDEAIQYALGHWGKEAVEWMDPDVRDKVLNRSRTRELREKVEPELTLDEVRRKYGESLTDEELILRTFIDEDAVELSRRAKPSTPYLGSQQPLVQLIEGLAKRGDRAFVSVQKGDVSLTLASSDSV